MKTQSDLPHWVKELDAEMKRQLELKDKSKAVVEKKNESGRE